MIYQIIWPPVRIFLLMIHRVYNVNASANELNNDLKKVHDWANQWKMSFNPDPSKEAQEVIFSRKSKRSTHPPLVFNNINVSQTFSQKQLGVILDFKLTFEDHLSNVSANVNKTIGFLRKLQSLLPRTTLILYTKLFFGNFWTMVMSCMRKPLITHLKKAWNLLNATHV